MNRRIELKKILFDYERNKTRIEQLREKYATPQGIKYDKVKVRTNKINKVVETSTESLLTDPEYIELDYKVKAVQCVLAMLTVRQNIIYIRYFKEGRTIRWIERFEPISKSTASREVEEIINMLEKELEKIGK